MTLSNTLSFAVLLSISIETHLIGQTHPADTDSDMHVSLVELTSYGRAWAEGTEWATGPSPVTEPYYKQAEYIWKKGERYRLMELLSLSLPQAWVPDPEDGTIFVAPAELFVLPLNVVEILGLPAGQTDVFAEFHSLDNPESQLSLVMELDPGKMGVVIPLIPDAPGGAGPFEMTIFSNEGTYPMGPVYPQPLPPAPGIGSAAAVALGEIIDQLSALFQESLGTYTNSPVDQIPEEMRIPVLVDRIFRDPGNPNNLENVLNGTAPILQQYNIDGDLLDRIHRKLGTLDQLTAYQSSLNAFPINPPVQANSTDGLTSFRTLSQPLSESLLVPIGSLSDLAAAMQKQCTHQERSTPGPNEKALRDQLSVVSSAVSIVGGPVGAAGAVSFNTTLWVLDTASQIVANQWPSDVSDFQVLPSQEFFLEDLCEDGTWEAKITASSKGWSLDKTLVTGLLNVLGGLQAANATEAASKAARSGLTAGEKVVVDVSMEVSGFAVGKTFPQNGIINVPPSVWSGIPINDGDLGLVDITYEGQSVKQATGSSFNYTLNEETGTTILRVVTKDGALGSCGAAQGGAVIIEVKQNKVSLSPLGGEVEPDEEKEFTAIMSDADHTEIEFFVSHGEILEQNQVGGSDEYKLRWKAPSEDEMPEGGITITARSMTQECLRANVVRERSTNLTPKRSNLVLDPSTTCLELGSTLTFKVIDTRGGDVPQITWELIGQGILAPNGVQAIYSTTVETGLVTIKATTVEDEPQVLEQSFSVGGCIQVTMIFELLRSSLSSPPVTVPMDLGQLIVTDLRAQEEGSLDPIEIYHLGGSASIEQINGGTINGTLNGHGAALKFFGEPDLENGKETFLGPNDSEITLFAGVAFDFDEDNLEPVSLGSQPGVINVKFAADASMSGNWGGTLSSELEFVAWHWDFSDGTSEVGEKISRNFSTNNPYDQFVVLTATNNLGQYVSFIQHLRFIDFSAEFQGPYNEALPTNCLSLLQDCPGDIILAGPRAGVLSQVIFAAVPNPEHPGKQLINISY